MRVVLLGFQAIRDSRRGNSVWTLDNGGQGASERAAFHGSLVSDLSGRKPIGKVFISVLTSFSHPSS